MNNQLYNPENNSVLKEEELLMLIGGSRNVNDILAVDGENTDKCNKCNKCNVCF